MVDLTAHSLGLAIQSQTKTRDISVYAMTDRIEALRYVEAMPDDLVCTGHQSKSFLLAWLAQENSRPLFYVFSKKGYGPVLLPLEHLKNGAAAYCGRSHANGNFPVGYKEDILALGQIDAQVLHDLAAMQTTIPDALYLERQYDVWQEIANPFVSSKSAKSPNLALSLSVDGGFKKVLQEHSGKRKRKRQRSQMRKLEELGTVTIVQHVPCSQVKQTLSKFFEMKAARFKDAGIHDVFAEESVKDMFLRTLMENCGCERPERQLKAILLDGEPISIIGCMMNADRMTVEFGTFDEKYAQAGPGDLLFYHAIENASESGFKIFDFGIGDECYKRSWCDIETWHYDTFVAITSKGRVATTAKRARSKIIATIKRDRRLWSITKSLRKFYGLIVKR